MNSGLAKTIFFSFFALAIAVVVLDWQSSKNFIFYGLTEATKWTRDRFGYFDVRKNLIISFAMLALPAVAGCYGVFAKDEHAPVVAMFAGIMCGIPIFVRGQAWWKNRRAAPKKRLEQTAFLKALGNLVRAEAGPEAIKIHFNNQIINQMGGRTYYRLFGWIYSDNLNYSEAVEEIQGLLAELSRNDEKYWFPR